MIKLKTNRLNQKKVKSKKISQIANELKPLNVGRVISCKLINKIVKSIKVGGFKKFKKKKCTNTNNQKT
jgi:hypothetical protein